MKMSKRSFLILLTILLLAGICIFQQKINTVTAGGKDNETVVTDWKDSVRFLGRCYKEADIVWMDYTCSGIEFEYTASGPGEEIVVDFCSDNYDAQNPERAARVGVFVNEDEIPCLDFLVDDTTVQRTIYQSAEAGKVRLKVLKLSEAKYGNVGVAQISSDAGGGALPQLQKSQYRLNLSATLLPAGTETKPHRKTPFRLQRKMET